MGGIGKRIGSGGGAAGQGRVISARVCSPPPWGREGVLWRRVARRREVCGREDGRALLRAMAAVRGDKRLMEQRAQPPPG